MAFRGIGHDELPDVTADQHHAENHAARHAENGTDELDIGALGSVGAVFAIPVADGAGGVSMRQFQATRVATGNVLASTSAIIEIPWPQAFADAAYTVVASIHVDAPGGPDALEVNGLGTKTAASIFVDLRNTTLVTRSGVVQAMAIHD